MGIPGGNKTEGIRQMQIGIDRGVVTPIEMRFHLARNLRTFDSQYERAILVAQPLVERYPGNPIFQLLLGNLNAEMGRPVKTAENFQAALKIANHPRRRIAAPLPVLPHMLRPRPRNRKNFPQLTALNLLFLPRSFAFPTAHYDPGSRLCVARFGSSLASKCIPIQTPRPTSSSLPTSRECSRRATDPPRTRR